MATTTTTRTRRSPEEWRTLAEELLPELQNGKRLSDFSDRIGSNTDAFRTALAQIGFDPHGEPLKLKEISASTPKTLAKRVATRRRAGAPWWLITAETGKSFGELTSLLEENGYTRNGENGGSESDETSPED